MNLLLFVWVARRYVYKDVPHATKRHVGGLSLKPPRGPVPPWALPRETPDMPIRGQASPLTLDLHLCHIPLSFLIYRTVRHQLDL